jgi:hypothetical protein
MMEAADSDKAGTTWSTSIARIQVGFQWRLAVDVRLVGLQIEGTTSGTGTTIVELATSSGVNPDIRINRCHIRCSSSSDTDNAVRVVFGGNVEIWSTILNGRGTSGSGFSDGWNGSTVEIYNSTISGFGSAIDRSGDSYTVTNCAVFDNTDDFSNIPSGVSYCASDDGDGTNSVSPSGGSWANEFNDAANGDFTLLTGGNLENGGTTITGGPSTDIDGDSWDATPSIGADEYVASGGGTTDLTTNEVIGGVPVLDSISLGVEHAATLSEIVAGTPIVDSLPLSITKALSFNEITVDPAVADQLSVGVAKPLTLNEIVIPAPTVDGVSIDAVRNLLFNEVISGVPVADQLSISVEHPLTLNEVVSGVPVLESPNIGTTGTTVDLTLNGIVVGIPVVDAVELGLIRNLELNGVENGVPQAERMQLSVVHPVTFNEVLLDVPVVDAATIGLKEFGETSSWRRRRIRYVASFRNRRF